MSSTWWRILALLGVLVVASDRDALACSCPMSGPPCQATWTADTVFVGTVVSMTPIDNVSLGAPYQSLLVKFSVERGFVNAPSGPIEIVTGMGGGDCGYRFKVGVTYLVYASRYGSSILTAGICSRTRPLAEAREDVQYLTTMGASPSGGRLYGRINEWRRDPAEERGADYGPVEGINVSVRGATFFRDAVTDADGRFQVPNLPVGKATVSIAVPPGFEPAAFEQEIDIRDVRACSQMDLTIQPLARASGFVMDASGRPAAGIDVDAVSHELAGFTPDQYQRPVKTDERGAFEFRDLPPGTYVFGISLTKDPYKRPRGQSFFLPGTTVASEASVVELKAGDRKEVGVLRLPATR
jgi:hypothetical protein